MNETSLGRDPIGRLFFQYSLPAMGAMLFLGFNTIVDGLFVGNYIGADALASVNLAIPFSSLCIAASIIIGIGGQSMMGRLLGAGEKEAANNAFRTAFLLILAVSLLFAGTAAAFPETIARLLGASDRLLPSTATYIRYTGIFLPFLTAMIVLDYALKTIAMPVYAMIALIVAVTIHMFFSWLFIAHFLWGIQGAALAMGIGALSSFIIALLPFLSRHCSLQLRKGHFCTATARHILYSGSAEGLTEVGTGITTFLFNLTLMRQIGEMGVAAFTVISYLSFIGNNMLIGLSDGAAAIISYNYGYKKAARVRTALKLAAGSAFLLGVLLFAVLFAGSKDIVALFLGHSDSPVLRFAAGGAAIYAFAFLFNGPNIIASGYFTAIGDPRHAAMIAVSKGLVLVVAGIFLWPLLFGIQGIWLTIPLAEFLTLLLSAVLLWRHNRP